jgi:hypothetical protein
VKGRDINRIGCIVLGVFLLIYAIAIGLSEGDVEGYIYIGGGLFLLCLWLSKNIKSN